MTFSRPLRIFIKLMANNKQAMNQLLVNTRNAKRDEKFDSYRENLTIHENIKIHTTEEIINDFFLWENTPQGYDYWQPLHEKLYWAIR